jgi:hypothetical protein
MAWIWGKDDKQKKGPKRDDDEQELPAQLHQEAIPKPGREEQSPLRYHGRAAVEYASVAHLLRCLLAQLTLLASIVLVHGLASKYATTWAYKREDGSRYHWIREQFPKDFPDARILGFEYPSRWYKDPVRTSLWECAAQLLTALIRDRCDPDSAKMSKERVCAPPADFASFCRCKHTHASVANPSDHLHRP